MSKAKRTADGQVVPNHVYVTALDGFDLTGTADNRGAFANLFASLTAGKTVYLPPCTGTGGIRLDGPLIIPSNCASVAFEGAELMSTALLRNFNGGSEGSPNYGFIVPAAGMTFRRLYFNAAPGTTGGAAILLAGSNTQSLDFTKMHEITISNVLTYGSGSPIGKWDVGIYSSGLAKTAGAKGNRDILVDDAFIGGCLGYNMKIVSNKNFSGMHLNLIGEAPANYPKVKIDGDYASGLGTDSLFLSGPQLGDMEIANVANVQIMTPTLATVLFGSNVYSANISAGAHSTVSGGAGTVNTRINGVLQGS